MEFISGATSAIASIPQCIEAAKQLYELRERFSQASVLITAIYTESMVVAASLSQVQNLLRGTTLQDKPELRGALDRALTGCWVVYQCLDEEVRDLTSEADVNDLGQRDLALFLLKETNLKEILQQIRGQHIALGLLIQGLQMQSISEIQWLAGENSVKLDQIAKQSKTLRQKYPSIRVPESVIDKDSIDDAHTILGDTEFSFDDEIVNSKAYRRAMAQAGTRSRTTDPDGDVGVAKGDPVDLNPLHNGKNDDEKEIDGAVAELMLQIDDPIESHNDETPPPPDNERKAAHSGILDDLETKVLPFMPPISLSPRPSMVLAETKPTSHASQERLSPVERASATTELVEDHEQEQGPSGTKDDISDEEKPPPLPPRPTLSPLPVAKSSEPTFDRRTVSSWHDIFSLSDTASLSLRDPGVRDTASKHDSKSFHKPPPLLVKKSSNISLPSSSNGRNSVENGKDDLERAWTSLLSAEEKYIDRLQKFTTAFYEAIIKEWPVLEKHLEAIALGRKLVLLHQEHILGALKEQLAGDPPARGDPRMFNKWASKTYRVLKEYSQRYPHALYALRLTRNRDQKFSPYVETLGLSLTYFGRSWEDYLTLPMVQLDTYITTLQSMSQIAQKSSTPLPIKHESRLQAALEVLQKLKMQCSALIEQSMNREDIQSLYRRIYTVDTSLVDVLNLAEPARRIVYQGPLAIKLKGYGAWESVHAVLLDNFFLWGKVKPPKTWKDQVQKGDSIFVVEKPVHVSQLTVRYPANSEQIQKASLLDDLPRGTSLYELSIEVRKNPSSLKRHTLGALSSDERNEWYRRLSAAAGSQSVGNST